MQSLWQASFTPGKVQTPMEELLLHGCKLMSWSYAWLSDWPSPQFFSDQRVTVIQTVPNDSRQSDIFDCQQKGRADRSSVRTRREVRFCHRTAPLDEFVSQEMLHYGSKRLNFALCNTNMSLYEHLKFYIFCRFCTHILPFLYIFCRFCTHILPFLYIFCRFCTHILPYKLDSTTTGTVGTIL